MKNRLIKAKNYLFPSNNGIWVSILFVILIQPILFTLLLSSDLDGDLLKKVAYLVLSLIVLLLPAIILRARWYFIVQGLFALLAPLDIAHLVLNKMPISVGFMTAVLQTDMHESMELLYTFKWVVVLFVCCCLLYGYAISKIENNYLFTKSAKLILISFFILLNGGLFLSMWRYTQSYEPIKVRLYSATSHLLMKYNKIYPYNILLAIQKSFAKERKISLLHERLKDFKFAISQKDTLNEREIYVVVIGESARYSHFSINGYTRETSPQLAKLKNLISFSNIYSTANVTGLAIPFLLTRATPLNEEPILSEKTFVDAFKEIGFHTAWIANQSMGNSFIERVASDTDYAYFTTVDFDANTNYDERLLAHVDKVLSSHQKRTFILVHTLGSHFRYNFRYPDSFAKFEPSLKGTVNYSILSPENKSLLVNSYDNTILYTDFFLSSLINRIEKENAVSSVVYISDHAENLFDDEEGKILHGDSRPTIYEIHVPMFVWTSDRYQTTFPDKMGSMYKNKDKKLSSSTLFHSIIDIANLTYPKEELLHSFASGQFVEDSVRYVQCTNEDIITF